MSTDTGIPIDPGLQAARFAAVMAATTHRMIERCERQARQRAERYGAAMKAAVHARAQGSKGPPRRPPSAPSPKNLPSARKTAPDTGGRPFHFSMSHVANGRRANPEKPGGRAARGTVKRQPGTGTEAKHQAYLERDEAVAGIGATSDQPRPPPPLHAWAKEKIEGTAGKGAGREQDMQSYIEDVDKQPAGTTAAASFGTIGDTVEARQAFWKSVARHESKKGGRTQTRLICELPHETTDEQRLAIARSFADQTFGALGVPYWGVIHAPTAKNDHRNYHIHFVFTERPAKRMKHPVTGEMVWDFEVAETTRSRSRNMRTRYPFRQNRSPQMRSIHLPKALRQKFASVVNAAMIGSGSPVRYDPRSYEDMGLERPNAATVVDAAAEALEQRSFKHIDAEWVRSLAGADLERSAEQASASLYKAKMRDTFILATARVAHLADPSCMLPRRFRQRKVSGPPGERALDALHCVLEGRHKRLVEDLVDAAIVRALHSVVKATVPDSCSATAPTMATDTPSDRPSDIDIAALHQAAIQELADIKKSRHLRRIRQRMFEVRHLRAWESVVDVVRPTKRSAIDAKGRLFIPGLGYDDDDWDEGPVHEPTGAHRPASATPEPPVGHAPRSSPPPPEVHQHDLAGEDARDEEKTPDSRRSGNAQPSRGETVQSSGHDAGRIPTTGSGTAADKATKERAGSSTASGFAVSPRIGSLLKAAGMAGTGLKVIGVAAAKAASGIPAASQAAIEHHRAAPQRAEDAAAARSRRQQALADAQRDASAKAPPVRAASIGATAERQPAPDVAAPRPAPVSHAAPPPVLSMPSEEERPKAPTPPLAPLPVARAPTPSPARRPATKRRGNKDFGM